MIVMFLFGLKYKKNQYFSEFAALKYMSGRNKILGERSVCAARLAL
jgi:hypothetical protein